MIYMTSKGQWRQGGSGGVYGVNNGDPQCDVDDEDMEAAEYYESAAEEAMIRHLDRQ